MTPRRMIPFALAVLSQEDADRIIARAKSLGAELGEGVDPS